MSAPPLPDQPTPVSTLTEAARAATALINVALPAKVISYDATKQTVTVRLAPKRARRKNKTELERYNQPDIANVPVAFPGTGAWSITWPIAAGDYGVVVVCDRSIDEWKSTGADRTDPQDPRRFDLTDCVFVPGGRPFTAVVAPAGVDASALVIAGALIKLGSSAASDAVALSTLVIAQLNALKTAITNWVPVPNDGGAALKTALTAGLFPSWPASVGATKVRAE